MKTLFMQKKQIKLKARALISGTLMVAHLLSGCLGSEGDTNNEETEDSSSFPSSLAVTSPFDVTDNDTDESEDSSLSAVILASSGAFVTRYAWATARIDQILNGTTATLCRFDPELFLATDTDAECFGPTVTYEAHPDAAPTDADYDGELPSKDVGLWAETDSARGHACAAAELNARMEGVRDKSMSALMGLASLVCVMRINSITEPNNDSEDLTSEMNALGISDVSFTSASITHDDSSGDDEWSYELGLEYTPGSDSHRIVVDMTHIPSGTALEYQGRLPYRVNDQMTGGNCPTSDVTDNGSLLYERAGADDLKVDVRTGQLCEHDSDGLTDGLVDPSNKYDSGSNPTGWANNFNILTAEFDPTTMNGDFSYSWQAGPNDANARIFNVHVDEDTDSGDQVGDAFFGYGDDIEDTDGSIGGFICNWAGPNNDHTLLDYSQYQQVTFNGTSGKFTADVSDIVYAPTVDCEYDGTGDFTYDSTMDGSADTDPADAVANELLDLSDVDFEIPDSPSNI